MITDPIEARRGNAFPVDQPMQALEQDHQVVRQLFERYFGTQDRLVRQEAGPYLLELLEMHSALEEATFYPAVQQVDSSLVDECKKEHEEVDQLVLQLKQTNLDDPQCERMMQQLRDAVLRHLDKEENRLFPAVRQSNLDLQAIGLQMQAYESTMVAGRAQRSEAPARPRS